MFRMHRNFLHATSFRFDFTKSLPLAVEGACVLSSLTSYYAWFSQCHGQGTPWHWSWLEWLPKVNFIRFGIKKDALSQYHIFCTIVVYSLRMLLYREVIFEILQNQILKIGVAIWDNIINSMSHPNESSPKIIYISWAQQVVLRQIDFFGNS